jgi:hypothetical protein
MRMVCFHYTAQYRQGETGWRAGNYTALDLSLTTFTVGVCFCLQHRILAHDGCALLAIVD